jgi:hypothetical protein
MGRLLIHDAYVVDAENASPVRSEGARRSVESLPQIGFLMPGKAALLVGVVIGVIIGNTRQGRAAFRSAGERVSRAWNDTRVQQRVDDIQTQVKERIPVVGDDIAEAIDRVKPAAKQKSAASSGPDPLGGVGAANLG